MSREQLLADLLKDEAYPPNPFIEPADIDEAIEDTTALTTVSAEARAVREADVASGLIQASLESIHHHLTALNAAGGATQGQFQLAQLAIESNCQRLGVPMIKSSVSLESYTEETPRQVISLEELEELITTVDANHEALAEDAHESCDSLCEVLKSAIPNAAARLGSIVACAEEGTSGEVTAVSGEDIAGYLMSGDEFPVDFQSYMLSYVAFGKKLAGEFMASVGKAAEKAADFKNVSFENEASFQGSTATAFAGAIDPRSSFSEEDYEVALPGAGPLFVDNDERGEGLEGVALELDGLAHEREPADPANFVPETEGEITELPKLTTEEIVTIGKALHSLAMECDTAQFQEDVYESSRTLDAAIQNYTTAYDAADDGVITAVNDTAAATVEYLSTMLTMVRWTPLYFLTNLVQTINAFSVYAERSLGKCMVSTESAAASSLIQVLKGKTVSTENLNTDTPPVDTGMGDGVTDGTGLEDAAPEGTTISLEGGFKFRSGMRVRYSKGYGKIIKVFDRPTKYKGEIHHCTKDNPKYEVKSDDGRHLSLHKASALTPV